MPNGLQANLLRLQKDLRTSMRAAKVKPKNAKRCAKLARTLPLVHSTTTGKFQTIAEDAFNVGHKLLSPEQLDFHGILPLRKESAEVSLGTEKFVFLYCGQFRYPETQFGLVFSPGLEAACGDGSRAVPFDTGCLHQKADWPTSAWEPAVAFLGRHYLPVPNYRKHLAARLRYLFTEPEDYVRPHGVPCHPDPIGLTPRPGKKLDSRSWTFEVQVPDEVPISMPHLDALMCPDDAESHPAALRLLGILEAQGVKILPRPSEDSQDFSALQYQLLEYIGI